MGVVPSERVLSISDHLYLSLYWFSLNFHWGAMLIVLLPSSFFVKKVKLCVFGVIFCTLRCLLKIKVVVLTVYRYSYSITG
jgi:hypothetical protein